MKKLTLLAFVLFTFVGYSNAQDAAPIKEDKTSTTEVFDLPETLVELQEARVFLSDLITKTTSDIEEEKQTIIAINKNKAKLDATDPELKTIQKEIETHNQSISNLNTLLASYKKNLAAIDEAIAKLPK